MTTTTGRFLARFPIRDLAPVPQLKREALEQLEEMTEGYTITGDWDFTVTYSTDRRTRYLVATAPAHTTLPEQTVHARRLRLTHAASDTPQLLPYITHPQKAAA